MKKRNKSYSVPETTVQNVIPVMEWYENGIFRLDNDTYAIICAFDNSGYLSRTEPEKERKYGVSKKLLCELPTDIHYQEIIYNAPLDIAQIKEAVCKGEGTDEYSSAFFSVQEHFAEGARKETSLKRYLLAISYKTTGGISPENKLMDVYSSLQSRFAEMDSSLRLLSWESVMAELYHCYHPFDEHMPSELEALYRRGNTYRDVIAADGIQYNMDYIRIGSGYARVFTVVSYGAEINDTLIYTLLNNDLTISLSKHIEHTGKEAALRQIKKQLQELESRRQTRLSKNHREGTSYVPLELQKSIEGCNQLLEALSGDEEFLRQTIYVTVYAGTREELESDCSKIKSIALSAHTTLKPVTVMVKDALKSIMPLGKDYLTRHQFMLSSEAAVATPFSFESFFDKNGFFYGYNDRSGEPLIINRKLDRSSNGFIFGVSGSGKGIWAKSEISNVLYQPYCKKDKIIVVDASGEFLPIADATGGKIIELNDGKDSFNPLFISNAQKQLLGSSAAQASKISHLIALLSRFKAGEGLTATEKAIIDDTATEAFKSRGANLKTFYDLLGKNTRPEAVEMQGWLKRYVEGSIRLFSGTEEEKSERFTVYTVKNLTGELRDAAMLSMLERIEAAMMENYAAGNWTWIWIDEMHRYFDYERNRYAAERFSRLFSEARKYGGILTGITQLPRPVLASKDGEVMFSNSRFIIISELDDINIESISQTMGLNEDQCRILRAPNVGQYVIRTRHAPMAVRLLYPGAKENEKNALYDLFNTSFSDKGGI